MFRRALFSPLETHYGAIRLGDRDTITTSHFVIGESRAVSSLSSDGFEQSVSCPSETRETAGRRSVYGDESCSSCSMYVINLCHSYCKMETLIETRPRCRGDAREKPGIRLETPRGEERKPEDRKTQKKREEKEIR